MATQTILADDALLATVADEQDDAHRFSWSAAIAGAFVATAVTLFLLTLGSGVGLSLVSATRMDSSDTVTFLTLGAVYFLAAQAFGFAAGGHLTGRLIGPRLEAVKEEEFRAGAHGLVVWALAVVATALLIAFSAAIGGGAVVGALAASNPARMQDHGEGTTAATDYWVDVLFRPATSQTHADNAFLRYAQAGPPTATDAASPPDAGQGSTNDDGSNPSATMQSSPDQPSTPQGGDTTTNAGPSPNTPSDDTQFNAASPQGRRVIMVNPAVPNALTPATTLNIADDKAQVRRILGAALAKGATMDANDRNEIARLVSQDIGLTFGAAAQRVNDVVARIRSNEMRTAETARKITSYASLWTALALLFGAVVATMAAVSARWEDDRVTFGLSR